MSDRKKNVRNLTEIYKHIEKDITRTLAGFQKIYKNGDDTDIFAELVFCILTPQMTPERCWDAVKELRKRNMLLKGGAKRIAEGLSSVRFRHKRGEYIYKARKIFIENGRMAIKQKINVFTNPHNTRTWLAENIKGMGYKEASHFLRNIGKGNDFAILDRHVLRNLYLLGMIEEIPASMSEKKYIEIENNMRLFAGEISIPLDHLDIVLWYKEKGFIFK